MVEAKAEGGSNPVAVGHVVDARGDVTIRVRGNVSNAANYPRGVIHQQVVINNFMRKPRLNGGPIPGIKNLLESLLAMAGSMSQGRNLLVHYIFPGFCMDAFILSSTKQT